MKTINMKSTHETNKMYRKKCIQFEKLVKMMTGINAALNDKAAAINQEVKKVLAERQFLLKKLAEYNDEVKPSQLYFTGKCEAKFYRDCCKERASKKKTKKKLQSLKSSTKNTNREEAMEETPRWHDLNYSGGIFD